MFKMNKIFWLVLVCLIAGFKYSIAQVGYPGNKPGFAIVKNAGNKISFENKVLEIEFTTAGNKLAIAGFEDKQMHQHLTLSKIALFALLLSNNQTITSNDFTLTGAPAESAIKGDHDAVNYADRLDGKKYAADLENKKTGLKIHWEASLRDGANYVRQVFTFIAADSIKVSKITLIELPAATGIKKAGTVDGSPLVNNNMFFSLEHPMSQIETQKNNYTIFLPRLEAINSAEPLTISSVWGVTPPNQMRRGFLYYIERERANPYHQVLHYNSWFDISWDDRKLNEKVCLDRIKVFKDSLIDKRKVQLKAFLFDDGWDDDKSLWQFNSGFPDKFNKLKEAAKACNAGLGVWISPWGGYGEPKMRRIEYGKKQNPPFETNENGFSLTGPVYYNRFKAATTAFIKNYNISMFKFDGVGAGNGASGASITYQKDIEAFLKLITGLRSEKPDLYLSLTVGTWPSVYWLKYGDAIWRAGDDTGVDGEGPKRQQWITYKDGQAYKNIVKRAPLFPLNSIMYHGICIADNGLPGSLEMDNKDINDEIWAFFGTGTSLQELYINPHKLNSNNWDCLRNASNWSKANAEALADTHWVGGDPSKGEVYGYAGWADKKGVLTLRNPTAHAKIFIVNVKKVLDLPAGFAPDYQFYDAKSKTKKQLYTGKNFPVKLAPFEVMVMDANQL
ncbi:MAG TPA: enterotoxin [Mucilaginibacter sp.]|nr:enterotoxin [Mucilaginibacter sp.]